MYFANAAEVHERSIALMRFLALVASELGVAEHVYVVGGAVRNYLLGVPIKDIDVVVDSIAMGHDADWFAEQVAAAIPVEVSLVTNQYGVAILTVKGDWLLDGHSMRGEIIEIATTREESYAKQHVSPEECKTQHGMGHKPAEVKPTDIETDIFRREFTFNTLLWPFSTLIDGPEHAEIRDITGRGLSDLEGKRIVTPLDPDKTFYDDPTRMVRAIKFMAKYDMEIPPPTADSIRRNAEELWCVPWEAVGAIFVENVLWEPKASEALRVMEEVGLLPVLIEMAELRPPFANYVSGKMRDEDRVELIFELLDAGFPLKVPITKVDPEQREEFRERTQGMTAAEAARYMEVFVQPPIDNRYLIERFGLQGRERGKLAPKAREALLADPALMDDPTALTAAVESIW